MVTLGLVFRGILALLVRRETPARLGILGRAHKAILELVFREIQASASKVIQALRATRAWQVFRVTPVPLVLRVILAQESKATLVRRGIQD